MINFRKEQLDILDYKSGVMAIPSVLGSGKTFILSHLALKLHKNLNPKKKILLLTYMNSSVENFYTRLKTLDKNLDNIHIKTIHKFSLDLIKENINFLNISSDFSLIDSVSHNRLVNDIFKIWFLENKDKFSIFFKNNSYNSEFQDDFYINLKFSMQKFISTAKNYGLSSELISKKILSIEENKVLDLSNSFYEVYQNKLKELNYLDYDDLLYFAYKLLKNQESIRAYYQNFYEYILEDEAQDSNLLQNKIVALITNKNLLKVGDSNQNITGTFTLSSPKLFRNFCAKTPCTMSLNTSYRSSKNIIDFSNLFLKYTSLKHPCLNARKALKMNFMSFKELESGNNVKSDKNKIRAYYAESFEEEILICLKKVKAFKKKFPEKSIGILCPKNANVTSLARKFEEESIEFEILNDYDQDNFNTYKKLSDILSFIHNPNNTSTFIRIFEEYLLNVKISDELKKLIYSSNVENILENDFLKNEYKYELEKLHKLLYFSLNNKEKVLIYIAQNFNFENSEIELIENICLNLKSIFKFNPKWSYKDLIFELKQVENNKISYFNWGNKKRRHSNKTIILSTYHKSKGREWDMVYMLGVNEDFFPVFLHKEQLGEKSYLNNNFSILEAGILAEFNKITKKNSSNPIESFKVSRIEESLRILYVGITRAKEYLIISSNEENQGNFYYILFSKLIKKLM